MQNKLKIFSGRSNPKLAEKISSYLGVALGRISFKTFSDGELWVKFEENIRGHDVFLIQSTNSPAENILELIFGVRDFMLKIKVKYLILILLHT